MGNRYHAVLDGEEHVTSHDAAVRGEVWLTLDALYSVLFAKVKPEWPNAIAKLVCVKLKPEHNKFDKRLELTTCQGNLHLSARDHDDSARIANICF